MPIAEQHSRNRMSSWLLKLRGRDRAMVRAKLLIDRGAREQALQFLQHSSQVFEQCSKLKAEAAIILFKFEEYSMAVEWLKRGGIAEFDQPTVFQWSAEIEQTGDRLLAIELLKLFLASGTHPEKHDPSEAHFRIARLYRMLGDTDATVHHVLRCLESGNYPNVLSMLCSMNSDREKELLLDRVGKLSEIADLPGHFANRLNFAIADIYKLNNQYSKAAIHIGRVRDDFESKGRAPSGTRQLKPAFLVIGTMKSGTTGFYHTLCQHPQIHAAIKKEVRYFSNADANDDWYFAHFPKLAAEQFGITGEATPNYYAMNVHQRIRETLPEVKLICLLRDPAERAISQYFHGLAHGNIKRPIDQFYGQKEFERFAGKSDEELEQIAYAVGEGNREFNSTLTYGLYVHYLRKWFREFDPQQILLLNFDEFKQHQDATICKTCDFLGIDRTDPLGLQRQFRGNYDPLDQSVKRVLPRLREFYAVPNRKLFEEFGIRFDTLQTESE